MALVDPDKEVTEEDADTLADAMAAAGELGKLVEEMEADLRRQIEGDIRKEMREEFRRKIDDE